MKTKFKVRKDFGGKEWRVEVTVDAPKNLSSFLTETKYKIKADALVAARDLGRAFTLGFTTAERHVGVVV
jgi:hypothetical protein